MFTHVFSFDILALPILYSIKVRIFPDLIRIAGNDVLVEYSASYCDTL